MLILGIESSCDETAAALVESGRTVRASVIAGQRELHEAFAGVVPEIASRAHVERLLPTLEATLREGGATLSDVDAISVGHRPGLIGSLLVGLAGAKALAWALGKPLIGVDHVHAHLYAGCLERDLPLFPALGLVVSGGHTSLFSLESPTQLSRLGGTIDDALGEAYDKAGSILGLPFPGGPHLDRLARQGDDRAVDFPVSRLGADSLDFSFSGLKTAMLYAARGVPGGEPAPELTERRRADLAAGFQRAACRAVILKVERALDRLASPRTLLTGGGVTANTRLRSELEGLASRRGLELRLPPLPFCLDNAAMIAGLGYHLLVSGRTDPLSLAACASSSW